MPRIKCKAVRSIDASTIDDHRYLVKTDEVAYCLEYTARQGFEYIHPKYGEVNSFIWNIKKKPNSDGQYYKKRDIRRAGELLRRVISNKWLDQATFIPIPSSKIAGESSFDPRMLHIAQAIPHPNLDIRELVTQRESTRASHEREGNRLQPDELIKLYEIDDALVDPAPKRIIVLDDVLTTGSHFKAMKTALLERYPDARIVGIFLARTVWIATDSSVLFENRLDSQ